MLNKDKAFHFMGGMGVAISLGIISLGLGLIAGISVAVAKEVYDSKHPEKHTVDGMDFIATMVGVLTAIEILKLG